ncbi:hypothetical protein MCOR14_000199 [Pyricularia oryzae]|nr:hypothetical protein MCOR30_011202 [Pyricularia oryzae]KAI6645367.1 hypothetical protein MCOR14_000199 [Pyricularia oryzae]
MLCIPFLILVLLFGNVLALAPVSSTQGLTTGQQVHRRGVPDPEEKESYVVDLQPPTVLSKCNSFNCHDPDRKPEVGETVVDGKVQKIPFDQLKLWKTVADAYDYIVKNFPKQFAYIYHIDGNAIEPEADPRTALAKISWSNVVGSRLIANKKFNPVEEPNRKFKAIKKKGASLLKSCFGLGGGKKPGKKCKSTGAAARAGAKVRRAAGDDQDADGDCECE